jgi:hypothetical protein
VAHVRKLARNAVANILLGNPQAVPLTPVYPISEVQDRIYPNRPTPLFEVELPAICVYTKSETAVPRDGEKLPKHYDRKLIITIEILATVETGFDDVIDSIAEKVEALLLAQWFLKDPVTDVETVDNLVMKGTEIAFVGEDVHNIIASGQITLEVEWNADIVFPALPDIFDEMKVDHDIDAASGDGHVGPEAEDEVTGIYTP